MAERREPWLEAEDLENRESYMVPVICEICGEEIDAGTFALKVDEDKWTHLECIRKQFKESKSDAVDGWFCDAVWRDAELVKWEEKWE